MGSHTSIEWTDATWNPVVGCTKISPGCANCYAFTLAERFRGVPGHPFEHGFDLTLAPHRLQDPLSWPRPRRIFTCSMSDVFHEKVPLEYVRAIFSVMESAHWHTFQILTKRSHRLTKLAPQLPWPSNVWIGVSVETDQYVSRIHDLATVPAAVKFLSLEPLLGPIDELPLHHMDWVITGGESGHRARYMDPDWVRSIRDQCKRENVAFFFKQYGGRREKRGGSSARLDGRLWHQFPDSVPANA